MLEQANTKNRKVLRSKMAEVFSDEIKALPAEVQYILLDDLVTAFQNRLSIFSQGKSRLLTEGLELTVDNERVIA
ncbi:MAG: hypothetical protein ABSE15_10350 [Candidatus Bathyarchaeia archaeon]|jgi:hypothetical protein